MICKFVSDSYMTTCKTGGEGVQMNQLIFSGYRLVVVVVVAIMTTTKKLPVP
jgi:hypothetical protein